MHNQDDKHQPLNENDDAPFVEPSWVKPVKIASGIMGMMIVAGLVLLVYGLSSGMGKLAEKNMADRSFAYPSDMTPIGASAGVDGTILLEFKNSDDAFVLVLIDPQRKKVISTTTLMPSADNNVPFNFTK